MVHTVQFARHKIRHNERKSFSSIPLEKIVSPLFNRAITPLNNIGGSCCMLLLLLHHIPLHLATHQLKLARLARLANRHTDSQTRRQTCRPEKAQRRPTRPTPKHLWPRQTANHQLEAASQRGVQRGDEPRIMSTRSDRISMEAALS